MPDYNVKDFSPSFGGQIDSEGNVKNLADAIKGTGANTKLAVDASFSLAPGDIKIGAVEIQDKDNNNRLSINNDGHIGVYIMGSVDGGGW